MERQVDWEEKGGGCKGPADYGNEVKREQKKYEEMKDFERTNNTER